MLNLLDRARNEDMGAVFWRGRDEGPRLKSDEAPRIITFSVEYTRDYKPEGGPPKGHAV